jgi:hypothetical protein
MLFFGIQLLAVFIHLHLIGQGIGHVEGDLFARLFEGNVNSPGWPAIRATTVSVFTVMLGMASSSLIFSSTTGRNQAS